MAKRDLLSIADLSPEEIRQVVGRASLLKEGEKSTALEGKSVAMLFEKPSLRTRVSFDVGIKELGGTLYTLAGTKWVWEAGRPFQTWLRCFPGT